MSTLVSQLFLRMSDVEPLPVEWAWDGLIPAGSLTLLSGDPGVGKSLVTLQVAAMVTRGVKTPRGLTSGDGLTPHVVQPGTLGKGVLVLSAADQPRQTVLPRLIAAGADPSQVFFLKGDVVDEPDEENDDAAVSVVRPFRLSQDMECNRRHRRACLGGTRDWPLSTSTHATLDVTAELVSVERVIDRSGIKRRSQHRFDAAEIIAPPR